MTRKRISEENNFLKRNTIFGKALFLSSALLLTLLLLSGCAPKDNQSRDIETGDSLTASAENKETVIPLQKADNSDTSLDSDPAGKEDEKDQNIEALIETAPITEEKHYREEGYMAVFPTHMLSPGPFSIHMEDTIYEETLLRESAKGLWKDLSAMEAAAKARPEAVTVYVVKQTIENAPAVAGTQVFCTLNDIESGAYRDLLVEAAYGLRAEWQKAGLTEYVFGEADTEDLKEYYMDDAHNLTASCSAFHLSSALADEETVRFARETAGSITAMLLENKDFSTFCEITDISEVLSGWSKSIGITRPLILPDKSREASEMKLKPQKGYLCGAQVRNLSIFIPKDSWLMDPDGLYSWLCDYFAGMELVMDRIREEAPSAADTAEQRFLEPIRIYFMDENQMTYCVPRNNEIWLSRADAIWHETVHLLLGSSVGQDLAWEDEGIAEHFSYPATMRYAPTQYVSRGYDAYMEFFAEMNENEATEDDLVFHKSVWNLYRLFRNPDWDENDDLEAYCRAYGISSLLLDGEITRTQFRIKYDRSITSRRSTKQGTKSTDGNALCYPEALIMTEYLAETYGMDEIVTVFMEGVSPEEAFGITYAQLYNEAKEYYDGLYREQMKQMPSAAVSLYLDDYENLWDALETSYPYLPYLRQNGTDVDAIYDRYRQEAEAVSDGGAFSGMIRRMFREMNNFAHLDLVSNELYQSYYYIYVLNSGLIPEEFSEPFGSILQDPGLSDLYEVPQSTDSDEDGSAADRTEPFTTFYNDCKTLYIRIPSFAQELAERDRDILYECMEKYPDTENVIFDITGNSGGSDYYWMENLVAPFGGSYEFEYRNYLRSSDLTEKYYAALETFPVSEMEEAPDWVNDLGLDRYFVTKMILPEENDGGRVIQKDIKKYLLTGSKVYSASDKFACFCKATGWATIVGNRTDGDGLGTTPILILLPESGLLVRFSAMAGENPDGTLNAAAGTSPDVVCVRNEQPLNRCLELIRGS